MKRSKFIYTIAATALLLPASAMANSPQASTDTSNAVGSEQSFYYDTNSPRISNGWAEFDANSIAMSMDAFRALTNVRGADFETVTGEVIGVVEGVSTNGRGYPELIVDLNDETPIPADVLVITVQPGNVTLDGNAIKLAASVEDLAVKARANSVRDSNDRVSVTIN